MLSAPYAGTRGYADGAMIALTAFEATAGLVFVFFILFPAIVTGLLAIVYFGILGERDDNQKYAKRRH